MSRPLWFNSRMTAWPPVRDFRERSEKTESKPLLHRDIWILDDQAAQIAREANRQSQREFAALSLGEKAEVVERLRLMVCSSSSDIVPFSPRSRRPLAVPGS